MAAQARVREDLKPNGCDWFFALRASGVGALADQGALEPTLFDEQGMAEIECRELIAAAAADLMEIRRRAERPLDKRKMRKHFDLRIGKGSFSPRRRKQEIAAEAALDGFYVVRTNPPEERMSAADSVLTCKRLGRVERAFRTMKTSDLQARAHLLICMLGYYVEMRMRDALAPMLFDDEDGPVRSATRPSPRPSGKQPPSARAPDRTSTTSGDCSRSSERLRRTGSSPWGRESRDSTSPPRRRRSKRKR